jgi:Penicillin amidase
VKFVEEQKHVLLEAGPEGEQVLEDLTNWAEGINAFEELLPEDERLPHVTVGDAIAGFAFIGSIFGNGGGQEVADSNFLAELEQRLGTSEGEKVYRDMRESNDPEAPVTTTEPFPYDQEPTGPEPGALVIDPGSMSASAVQAAQVTRASRRRASNFLVVGAGKTKAKHPLAVMGPQLGYFYPEIVMQGELRGGGIDAEGIIAPISPYVFIGRGSDFAWSLTSADNENVQQFLLKLCNPEGGTVARESEYYEYEGACIKMSTFDAGTLGAAGGEPEHEVYFKESVYGPVSGTVTVKGAPYAIANDRTSRGREPAGELAFSALDSNKVHNPEQFFEAANKLETTFNMSYLDSENIAYFSTGRLPVLAPGTNPSLPTLGNGEYNWRGFLSQDQHPHAVDQASDLFLNWNNKPAPEWGAASDNFDYGPVHRVQLYTGFTNEMTEANDVSIMNEAATTVRRRLVRVRVQGSAQRAGPARRRRVQSRVLRERQPRSVQRLAVGGDPAGDRTAGRTAGIGPERLEGTEGADHLRARPAAVHDALDQPLDLPAGDRIHRPRRRRRGFIASIGGRMRVRPRTGDLGHIRRYGPRPGTSGHARRAVTRSRACDPRHGLVSSELQVKLAAPAGPTALLERGLDRGEQLGGADRVCRGIIGRRGRAAPHDVAVVILSAPVVMNGFAFLVDRDSHRARGLSPAHGVSLAAADRGARFEAGTGTALASEAGRARL